MRTAQREENAEYLLGRFFAHLCALRPRSVLDVGCGSGDLLRRCRAAGLPAIGLERDGAHAAQAARAAGSHCVVRGVAERLPFAARAADWVTLRHVPHHLADPAAAFAEALRVCRSGVLVAEPWFDPELPCQRNARAVDAWIKRQQRRAGQLHRDVLGPHAIRTALGAGSRLDLEVDVVLRPRARPQQDLWAEAGPLLAALPGPHPDRAAWAELQRRIDRDGLSWNGSLLVTVRPS